MSLVLLSTWPLFRIPFEVVPLRPVLPLSNENETSESIVSKFKRNKKEQKMMQNQKNK